MQFQVGIHFVNWKQIMIDANNYCKSQRQGHSLSNTVIIRGTAVFSIPNTHTESIFDLM